MRGGKRLLRAHGITTEGVGGDTVGAETRKSKWKFGSRGPNFYFKFRCRIIRWIAAVRKYTKNLRFWRSPHH